VSRAVFFGARFRGLTTTTEELEMKMRNVRITVAPGLGDITEATPERVSVICNFADGKPLLLTMSANEASVLADTLKAACDVANGTLKPLGSA
jgi:hypothetical protein